MKPHPVLICLYDVTINDIEYMKIYIINGKKYTGNYEIIIMSGNIHFIKIKYEIVYFLYRKLSFNFIHLLLFFSIYVQFLFVIKRSFLSDVPLYTCNHSAPQGHSLHLYAPHCISAVL